MNNFQALILGITQGLTEYLPISSSAHLVFVPAIFDWRFSLKEAFIFDILVQLGTLLGVLIFFREKILKVFFGVLKNNEEGKFAWLVLLATIPAAIIGILFKDFFEKYFSSPKSSAIFLIITGFLLIFAEKYKPKSNTNHSIKTAIFMGLMQALALFPGISRSGSTIACGIFLGLSRKDAAQFSFFMSIPVMLGAGLLASIDLINAKESFDYFNMPILIGFISSAFFGYLVIKWFMKYISTKSLNLFAYYCITIGLIGSLFFSN